MNLNQVTVPVINMPKSIKFYCGLGLIQIVDTPHYARFSCPEGDATFSLNLTETNFINGSTIYFEHKDLDSYVEQLQSKGFEFSQLPTDQRYLWREAVLLDPSNNQIKLYWAGDNRLIPPWKMKNQ